MSLKKIILIVTCVMLILPVVSAQAPGARWVPVALKENWAQTSTGFCNEASQCLVSNAFNENFDNIPDAFFDGFLDPALGPKCINDTQSILDHYCLNGSWSSRTRLVATQLLGIALDVSPSNFSLYCSSFDRVLNRFDYSVNAGPVLQFLNDTCILQSFLGVPIPQNCINNVCVLKYGQNVAVGFSSNVPANDPQSPVQAFNVSAAQCTSAINNDGKYDPCGNDVWYNHQDKFSPISSFIYAQGLIVMPDPARLANDFFTVPYNKLRNYVFTVVHKPAIPRFNYTFFNTTPDFTEVYMAKNGFNLAYGFRQRNITFSQIDYSAEYLSNINVPNDTCARILKRYDDRTDCEDQPSPNEFFIVASKHPPLGNIAPRSIVDAWEDMTGKVRLTQ